MSIIIGNIRSFIPPQCLLCRSPSDQDISLCSFCQRDLPWLNTHCPRCAMPMLQTALCGNCQQKCPPYSRCISAFEYTSPISQLINHYKTKANLCAGRVLSELLADHLLPQLSHKPDLLVAVPLHWQRQLQRGFNQSLDIALYLSRRLNIPCAQQALHKIRVTRYQHDLHRSARMKNLNKAFRASATGLGDKRIALIDDVVTTGSTVSIATQQLLKAGAKDVQVWCLARTPLD